MSPPSSAHVGISDWSTALSQRLHEASADLRAEAIEYRARPHVERALVETFLETVARPALTEVRNVLLNHGVSAYLEPREGGVQLTVPGRRGLPSVRYAVLCYGAHAVMEMEARGEVQSRPFEPSDLFSISPAHIKAPVVLELTGRPLQTTRGLPR